jgi:hypothetical protein
MEKENINSVNLPADLLFIWSLNISALKRNLQQKYTQRIPKTPFQTSLKNRSFSGQIREYLKEYGLEEEMLFGVYERLEQKARENGIIVEYIDLSNFIEDEYYKNEPDSTYIRHAETARSDGKTLFLEKDLEKSGGIAGRMYDLIHLAFGHIVQWSTVDTDALLAKEQAWNIGYRNHEKSPDVVLDLMQLYELEAGMMGVNALMATLKNIPELSSEEKEAIIQYFTDYVYTDNKFIIQHYKGGKNKFEHYFLPGQDVPPEYESLVVPTYIKRHAVEIGLLKDQQDPSI